MENFDYVVQVQQLIEKIASTQHEQIKQVSQLLADNIRGNHIIHVFGTGHSMLSAQEIFGRAGGLGNVNAILDPEVTEIFGAKRASKIEQLSGLADIIYDNYEINATDIMIVISNSGRNSLPIEMALRAKAEGLTVIALTNVTQSSNQTSRHPSGQRLYEIADINLDNCIPTGDGVITYGDVLTGPVSTIANCVLLHTCICEALALLHAEGFDLPVLQSQNVDGANNDAIYAKYTGRVKHY